MRTSTTKTRSAIRYPIAYRQPFQITHIDDAERKAQYLCLGCHKDMIPRKGRIKKHHFAHKAGQEQCDPDNALHETAKAAICEGFLRALRDGQEYAVSIACDRCAGKIGTNVAIDGATIATERIAVTGTRSDLVITTADGNTPRIIVEIVVHHDLETETKTRYETSGIPIIKVIPTWETVDTLREAIDSPESLNAKITTCRQCRHQEALHQRWLTTIEAQLQKAIGHKQVTRPRIEQITKDRYDSFLRADTRSQVNKNARSLAELGFLQQKTRATLFKVQIPQWTIYADLDSTEVMRIWEVDCEPGLYAFPQELEPPKCRECLLEAVREILEQHDVTVRRYFMDHGSHNHWTALEH